MSSVVLPFLYTIHSYLNALVPGVPQVNLIPVYSGDSQTLTRLNIEISGPLVSVCF